MSIDFDTMPPRAPRRSASVPTSASLLNRIQKPPLVERLSRDDSVLKAPSRPYVHSFYPPFDFRLPCFFFSFRRAFTGGPVRNRPSHGGGGNSANTNTNIARAPKGPKKTKTAAELDQELDAFMGDADVVSAVDAAAPAAGDVDMA
jgi:THO complex subunit 4